MGVAALSVQARHRIAQGSRAVPRAGLAGSAGLPIRRHVLGDVGQE